MCQFPTPSDTPAANHVHEGAISCGPMSLWRMAGLLGQKSLSLEEVARRFIKPEAACNGKELLKVGQELGLNLVCVRSSLEQLELAVMTLGLPVILHLHGDHWVTIRLRAMGRIGRWDGSQETITSLSKIHRSWSGVMLVVCWSKA